MGRPPAKPAPALDRGLLPSLLGYVLRRTQSAVFADFAATFAKAGEALTPGEFGLLVLVERNAGLSQMALARALGIDRSTLVPILDRLQARGLLVRHRLADRRPHPCARPDAGGREGAGAVRAAGEGAREAHRRRAFRSAETRTLIELLEKVHGGARSL